MQRTIIHRLKLIIKYKWRDCLVPLQVQYVNEEHIFSPSQVVAMMLGYLKGVGAKALAKPITDCVVAVSITIRHWLRLYIHVHVLI